MANGAEGTQTSTRAYLRKVADRSSVFVIAEAGVNHNGDLETATELIVAAVEAGADAVKFQTFDADRLVATGTSQAPYQQETDPWESQHEMLRQYELDRDDHEYLQSYCEERGIPFLSTPFDRESATLLDDLGVPLIKLGSGELDNYPLLEHVAGFGRPMLVSTGMGTLAEVEAALARIRSVDPAVPVAFMHCTTSYPTPESAANLGAMEAMTDALPVPVGYSDHTTSVEVPGFAAAAGAAVVEKHLTLDTDMEGPDHAASMEPDAFAAAVDRARAGAKVRGTPAKRPAPVERENVRHVRKSLHAAESLAPGEELTEHSISILRPAVGLSPALYEHVLGREVDEDLDAGDAITAADVAGDLPTDEIPGNPIVPPGGDDR